MWATTHGRWPAGPGLGPVPPRKKVAVAGPPFIIIIMALRCPSPWLIEREGREAISTDPQATKENTPPSSTCDATHHRQNPRGVFAPEMISRLDAGGAGLPTQAAPASRRLCTRQSSCLSLHRWSLLITVTEIHCEIAFNACYRPKTPSCTFGSETGPFHAVRPSKLGPSTSERLAAHLPDYRFSSLPCVVRLF